MPTRRGERQLLTVLFLDIVGSTRIASDIGDRRWRELLSRFRGIVRRELKRFGGREEDTAGDGFLATFDKPAKGVEAGAAIALAVHEVGLEVRTGLHTGECEILDGKLAGLAVHLAARVMSLGGAADVLVTSTVKDLVIGAGIEFQDFGSHQLKGVPGTWNVARVVSQTGVALAQPLPPEEASERIAAVEPPPFLRRRRNLVAGGTLLVAAAVAVALVLVAQAGPPITLARIDPTTNRVVQVLHDAYYSHHLPGPSLQSSNGSLWQLTPTAAVRRDIRTGKPEFTFSIAQQVDAGALGFGSLWTATGLGGRGTAIRRYDEVTARLQATIDVPSHQIDSMSAGNGAMWALSPDGSLVELDPLTDKVTSVSATSTQHPGVVVALDGSVWICDCEAGHYLRFDPQKMQVVDTLTLPEHGFLIDVDAQHDHTLWVLDPDGNTLTPVQPTTGAEGEPLGFGGHLADAVIGFGSLWIAASNAVYRIDLTTHHQQRIEIPTDMTAGSIAVDEQTGTVWVVNCGCPRNG